MFTPTPETCERNETFARLYEQYHHPIYCFIKARIQSAEMAEDLTSGVFEKMVSKFEPDAPNANAKSWLFTVAYHMTIDAFRDARRCSVVSLETLVRETSELDHDLPFEIMDTSPSIEDQVGYQELIDNALTLLPLRQREVIAGYVRDAGPTEIARDMGVTLGSVKAHMTRSRMYLRAHRDWLMGVA